MTASGPTKIEHALRYQMGRDLMALFKKTGKPRTAEDCWRPLKKQPMHVQTFLSALVREKRLISEVWKGTTVYALPPNDGEE